MEVGIHKRAWQRDWRYPAYLWSLRWVCAVKQKTRRLVYAVYPRIPPPNTPLITPNYPSCIELRKAAGSRLTISISSALNDVVLAEHSSSLLFSPGRRDGRLMIFCCVVAAIGLHRLDCAAEDKIARCLPISQNVERVVPRSCRLFVSGHIAYQWFAYIYCCIPNYL